MNDSIKIAIVGDISTWNIDKFSIQKIDQHLLEKIKSSDLFIVNLEGPIVDDVKKHHFQLYKNYFLDLFWKMVLSLTNKKQPIVYSNNGLIGFLKINGNTVVTLANNHIKDCGLSGLVSTLKILDKNKIKSFGAGLNRKQANKYIHLKIKDEDIFIFNYNRIGLRKFGLFANIYGATRQDYGAAYLSFREIKKSIDAIRIMCPKGRILLISHDGKELPNQFEDLKLDPKIYRSLGADLTVIHHPHVTWDLNKENIKIIGDFLFYRPKVLLDNRASSIIELTINDKRTVIEEFPIKFNKGYPFLAMKQKNMRRSISEADDV